MSDVVTPSEISQKSWVSDGERVVAPDDYNPLWDTVKWVADDGLITFDQIQAAFADPDVQVCDIHCQSGGLTVNLEATASQSWPVFAEKRLRAMATLRHGMNSHEYDGDIADKPVNFILRHARKNVDDAITADDRRNMLEVEESLADALIHMLVALDQIVDEEDGSYDR